MLGDKRDLPSYLQSTTGDSGSSGSSINSDQIVKDLRTGRQSVQEGRKIPTTSANAIDALNRQYRTLQNEAKKAVRVRELPDGRIRYYGVEKPSKTPGPTRGASLVTEYDPKRGRVRTWYENYDHAGNVNRVHPKSESGLPVNSQHFPPTNRELQRKLQ